MYKCNLLLFVEEYASCISENTWLQLYSYSYTFTFSKIIFQTPCYRCTKRLETLPYEHILEIPVESFHDYYHLYVQISLKKTQTYERLR